MAKNDILLTLIVTLHYHFFPPLTSRPLAGGEQIVISRLLSLDPTPTLSNFQHAVLQVVLPGISGTPH